MVEIEPHRQRPLDGSTPPGRIVRVSIVIGSMSPPRWIFETIRAVQRSGGGQEILFYHLVEGQGFHRSVLKPFGAWIRMYRCLDGILFRSPWDEMEETKLSPLLPPGGAERIFLEGDSPHRSAHNVKNPDLALFFENGVEASKRVGVLLGCPVWRFQAGEKEEFSQHTIGFREVQEDAPVTTLSLMEERQGQSPRSIATAVFPTHRYSPWKNRNNILGHSPSLVVEGLRRWGNSLPPIEVVSATKGEGILSGGKERPRILPLLTRIAKKQIHRLTHRDQWFIGYRQGEPFRPDGGMENFRIAVPPGDRFWADPFPASIGKHHFIFFEEYLFKKQKAHIACVELTARGEWGRPVTVLQRDYHLSYPHLFHFEDVVYMVPETSANRTIEVYRCLSFPYEWRLEKVLMENIVAADTTIRFVDGLWWMFTSLGSADGRQFNELWAFYSDHPLGGWRAHPLNPLLIDARFARGAGNLFEWKGAIYRPAQNCSRNYGEHIYIRRISELSQRSFREEEALSILPTWTKNIERVHTVNFSGDLTVIDGFRWRRKVFDTFNVPSDRSPY
jgi:hypothetical protein